MESALEALHAFATSVQAAFLCCRARSLSGYAAALLGNRWGLTEDPLIKTARIFTARSLGRRISGPSGCPPTRPPSLLKVWKEVRFFIARAIAWLIDERLSEASCES